MVVMPVVMAIIPAMQAPLRWLAEPELPQLCTDSNVTRWLQERGSLTARLRHQWGDVAVHLLDECLACPLPHESVRLRLSPSTLAWVRCVLLVCQNQPRVYARTVIPDWSALNPWAEVQQLGRQPLGELLFRLPKLERSGFEWSQGGSWLHADRWAGQANTSAKPEPLARRCVFVREQAPLLLTEVFLGLPLATTAATAADPPAP
jgi:chorismate--pyruvate lyase